VAATIVKPTKERHRPIYLGSGRPPTPASSAMSAAQIDSALHPAAGPAPTAIPPRTSSHGAAFVSQSPPGTSSSATAATAAPLGKLSGNVSPPHRRSSKRPVSTTSENWLAQSSGKKPLTAVNSTSMSSDRGDKGSRRHSHSHRPKSAHTSLHPNKLLTATLAHAGSSPPPQGPSRTIGDDHINPKHAPWPAEKEKILLGPFEYLYGHPGKDIRSQCIAAFNEWLRVPDAKLAVITKVVGMLHTASLLYADHARFHIPVKTAC
jgi:geranylgeranyl diphosphate synthase, type III